MTSTVPNLFMDQQLPYYKEKLQYSNQSQTRYNAYHYHYQYQNIIKMYNNTSISSLLMDTLFLPLNQKSKFRQFSSMIINIYCSNQDSTWYGTREYDAHGFSVTIIFGYNEFKIYNNWKNTFFLFWLKCMEIWTCGHYWNSHHVHERKI